MRFEGAPADLEELRVAPEPLHRELAAVARAPHHLHRPIRDGLADRRREELGRVGADPRAVAGANIAGDVVSQATRGLRHRVAVADVALNLAETVERFAERPALVRVADHDIDAPARDPTAHRRQGDALDLEVAHHVGHATADLTEEVCVRDAAAFKDELAHRAPAHAELVDVIRGRKPRAVTVDDERGDPRVDFCVHQEAMSFAAVGDVGLGAVDHPIITVAPRRCAHPENVGPRARLGHPHPRDPLAAHHLGEVAPALLVVGRVVEVVHEQHRVREISQTKTRVGLRQLLVHDHRGDGVQARAAVSLGNRDPEDAELAELLEQRAVEHAALVEGRRLRFDLTTHEVGDRLAEHPMLVGGIEQRIR